MKRGKDSMLRQQKTLRLATKTKLHLKHQESYLNDILQAHFVKYVVTSYPTKP